MGRYEYNNRDISWLSFNLRVLEEAMDKTLPLYERIKFLAIYSNNMEEFYQVRVSYYKQMLRHERDLPQEHFREVDPAGTIRKINHIVSDQQAIFHRVFEKEIIPDLKRNNIILVNNEQELSAEQEDHIRKVFYSTIITELQPVLLVKGKVRPFLKTGQPYLALSLSSKDSSNKRIQERYAILKIPTDLDIGRFVELPMENGSDYIMFVEDVIMRHIDSILPGYRVNGCFSLKLTRDADLEYDDYEGDDLIDAIDTIRQVRSLGKPNRFQFDRSMPQRQIEYLKENFHISDDLMIKGGNRHNFRDFFGFPNPRYPELEIESLPPIPIPALSNQKKPIATLVAKEDYLLNVPYQPFEHYLRFLREAATDPTVKEIMATQYRVSEHSAVVNSMIAAAENGKKVTVFVELKARFDEEANLKWANQMTKAGIRIIYSIPGLKVHAKLMLVVRKKGGKQGDQAYLGTGNFNEKTARLYGDHGLFTSRPALIADIKELFSYLEDQKFKPKFKKILVPGFNLIPTFRELIDREIETSRKGGLGYILLKMNGLQDKEMVDKLYEASEAGVKVDLIIRGVCTLKTGQPYSRNIRVVRIVDRFLEHARIFAFLNQGEHEVYLGSADWMKRNLRKRIECVFPVEYPDLKKEILDLLHIQLSDNVKACEIDAELNNVRITTKGPDHRAQTASYEYLKNKYSIPKYADS